MKLTDLKIRKLKPRSKPYRVNDSSGLVLEVTPQGNKIWVMCCSIADKIAREIILGEYPACSLTEARQWHKIYCAGIDKLSIQNYTLDQPTNQPTNQRML